MRKSLLFLLVILTMMIFGVFTKIYSNDMEYIYLKICGNVNTEVHVSFKAEEDLMVEKKDSTEIIKSRKDGMTMVWEGKKDGKNFKADLRGNEIYFVYGKNEKVHNIGNKKWIQSLSFGFSDFVMSKEKEMVFYTIRSSDFAFYEIRVWKEREESIQIENNIYNTMMVKMGLTGLSAIFSNPSSYWFRLHDGLLVKYAGIEGPPGTPETVMTLQDEIKGNIQN